MTSTRERGTQIVAAILATGLVLAVVLITAGVLYDAIFSEGPGLSDNATQVLTGAFGGIIGVLGSYIGYQAAARTNGAPMTQTEPPAPEPTPDETPDFGPVTGAPPPSDEPGEDHTADDDENA